MGILSDTERRGRRGRLLMLCIYAVLFAGAVTMVYPFLLMLRMTTSDGIDRDSVSPIPLFLVDMDLLSRKYLNRQYVLVPRWMLPPAYGSGDWGTLAETTGFWNAHLARLESIPEDQLKRRVLDFQDFVAQADPRFVLPGLRFDPDASYFDRWISRYLADKENVPLRTHIFFEAVRPDFLRRDWTPPHGKNWDLWQEWLAQLPARDRFVTAPTWVWQQFLATKYNNDTTALNRAHGTNLPDFTSTSKFPTTPPATPPPLVADWKEFVAKKYPLLWQKLTPETAASHSVNWRAWLAETRGIGDAAAWTAATGLPAGDGYAGLPVMMPREELAASLWARFVAQSVPVEDRILLSSEDSFAEFLSARYGSLERLEEAWGISAADWGAVHFPVAESDFFILSGHRWGIRWDLCTQNFRIATQLLITEGRAFVNTFVVIVLCVVTVLTVNPLAAYALSRFRMPGTYRILIFFLATMALPAEVALVPGFLLVRDLQLTDTLWALVLPTAANAFAIFLLKGFFDSLPVELYEAAVLDGAGELELFTRITIPLSLPVLAVILLWTVTAAYTLFMPAVLYIGDADKWPLAVKIYEINQSWPPGVGMAALVMASVFPLLVFFLCQRIILRGIVLPGTH